MRKISDYELTQLESEDLAIPIEKFKRKKKTIKKKYNDHKRTRGKDEIQDWYEKNNSEDYSEDL